MRTLLSVSQRRGPEVGLGDCGSGQSLLPISAKSANSPSLRAGRDWPVKPTNRELSQVDLQNFFPLPASGRNIPAALPMGSLSRLCPAALLLFLGAHDPFDLAFVLHG